MLLTENRDEMIMFTTKKLDGLISRENIVLSVPNKWTANMGNDKGANEKIFRGVKFSELLGLS